MKNRSIKINVAVAVDWTHKDQKAIHIYGVIASMTAGYGYVSIEDFIKQVTKFCNISKRTAQRWITRLKQNKLIKIKKGTIYVKGRKTLEQDHDISQRYIKFEEEHLKSYSNFQKHLIQQIALLTQQRMSHHIRKSKVEDPTSLVKSGVVETELAVVRSARKAGCSISQLTKILGFDKMTISRALQGVTQKQFASTYAIKGTIARKKYKELFNGIAGGNSCNRRISYKWSFDYNSNNDSYKIKYALASRVLVDSYLCK